MIRTDGYIEMTEEEIVSLWEQCYGAPFPPELKLDEALKAVMMKMGVAELERYMNG